MGESRLELKHFPEWLELKQRIHQANKVQRFNEGDVWWAALGENVGVEMNGKSREFSRPVIVYKKLSRDGFLAVPLTSQRMGKLTAADFKKIKVGFRKLYT